MDKHLIYLMLIICFLALDSFAQLKLSGNLQSSLYAWEDLEQNQQTDFYQGLQLRLSPQSYSNLSFSTYMRIANQNNPNEWNDRLYNISVNWKDNLNRIQFRLGRQFIYSGVMNGTVDGLLVSANPVKNLNIKFLGGLEAANNREFGLKKWDEGNVLGGYLSYRTPLQSKIDVSYFQRIRNEETIWQLAGFSFNGKMQKSLYYHAQLDYNLQSSEYQGIRYRLSYYFQNWSLSAEYNSQKPRIHEDSYFKIFKLEAFNQVRGGITYQLKNYQLGLYLLNTQYENESTNQMQFTFGSSWGMIGFIYQDGFGGDNTGIYGEIKYPILSNLTLRLFSSYYNFQRHTLDISEEATSFSGGFEYRLTRQFRIQAEVQESMNSYFDNDLCGLFRLNYAFNY